MILCVHNNKGGTLKTSVVTNLGGVLNANKKKVLIIDCDQQANATLTFGINPDNLEFTLSDVLLDNVHPDKAIVNKGSYLDILPSNRSLMRMDFEVLRNSDDYDDVYSILSNAISPIADRYDHILIDCPTSLSLIVGNVYSFSDNVLIPFSPESYSFRAVIEVLDEVFQFQESQNPKLSIIGIVGTNVRSNTNVHSLALNEIKEFCTEESIHFFETVIPQAIRYADAVAYQQLPLSMTKSGRKDAESYFKLWKEIESNAQQRKA